MNVHATTKFKTTTEAPARRVAYRTRGHSQGPITRLVSPSDVGALILFNACARVNVREDHVARLEIGPQPCEVPRRHPGHASKGALNADDRTHAVTIALKRGIIDI